MNVGWMRVDSTFWSNVSYRALPQVWATPSMSTPTLFASATPASASPSMAMKSAPVTFLTASAMVTRFHEGVRSIWWPSHSIW